MEGDSHLAFHIVKKQVSDHEIQLISIDNDDGEVLVVREILEKLSGLPTSFVHELKAMAITWPLPYMTSATAAYANGAPYWIHASRTWALAQQAWVAIPSVGCATKFHPCGTAHCGCVRRRIATLHTELRVKARKFTSKKTLM